MKFVYLDQYRFTFFVILHTVDATTWLEIFVANSLPHVAALVCKLTMIATLTYFNVLSY